jgi:ketosteroid isomerase-like protein
MNDKLKAVQIANEAYYSAFAGNDYAAMDALWSNEQAIAIIHPGWEPLHGRKSVMESWRNIMDGPGESTIHCLDAVVYIMGDTAFVICTERLPETDLVATNIFVMEQDKWKMVHHQAGLLPMMLQEMPAGIVH